MQLVSFYSSHESFLAAFAFKC